MKMILITTVAAMLAGSAFCQAPAANPVSDPTAKETVAEKARNLWVKSKGYLSENESTYKEGAQQTLVDLGKEIDTVTAKAGTTPPAYLQTRIQSLKQQHLHLSAKLGELNGEAIKTRLSGPRYAFDQCVGSLESAIDQAENEVDVLAKVNSPDKK